MAITEQTWLTSDNPLPMLEYLRGKASIRKLRLFVVASCCRLGHIIGEENARCVRDTGEGCADGELDGKAVASLVKKHLRGNSPGSGSVDDDVHNYIWEAVRTIARTKTVAHAKNAATKTKIAAGAAAWAASEREKVSDVRALARARDAAWAVERKAQAALLRHLLGNPFRPCVAPDHWPSNVTKLADALYNGQDCGFALHDALLEAGHPELAEHFRQEQSHPKGCWLVDVVLGKK